MRRRRLSPSPRARHAVGRRLRSLIAPGALAIGVAACGAAFPPEPAALVAAPIARDTAALFQTDSLAYTLRAGDVGYEGEIGVTFTNRTGAPAYVANCQGGTALRLEKRVDGRWQTVWSPVLLMCLSPPIVVPAGASWRTRIAVFGGYPGTSYGPQFSVPDIAGEYRAVWTDVLRSYQDRLPFGDPLPPEARTSNRFLLATEAR